MVTLDLLSTVVQPSIPLAITVGIGISLQQLNKKGIICLSPPKIKLGGNLDVILLDKQRLIDEKGTSIFGFVAFKDNDALDI